MIEAEFHAVWRDPAGVLRDIAPKPDGISRILFLRDPSRRYESRQVNNIREALWDSLEVHELIAAANARFEFMDRGERAHQHGKIALRGRERDEWLALQDRWETATVNLQEAIAAGHRPPAAATRQPAQLDLIDRNAKKRARRAQR